jgi:hypothetical protein
MKPHRRKDLKYGDDGAIPKPYLLLNISRQYKDGIKGETLRARACKYWKLNPNLHKHKQVRRAIVFADNIIRAVYRIDDWKSVDMKTEGTDPLRLHGKGIDSPSKTRKRWKFIGEEDRETWGKLVGQSVPKELGKRRNPISWII